MRGFSFATEKIRQVITTTGCFKRTMVLYIPRAPTAAKLLRYLFFVLYVLQFQYNELLYSRAFASNEAYIVLFATFDQDVIREREVQLSCRN